MGVPLLPFSRQRIYGYSKWDYHILGVHILGIGDHDSDVPNSPPNRKADDVPRLCFRLLLAAKLLKVGQKLLLLVV